MVLVLNQNYEPLNITDERRAFVLVYLGRAEVIRNDTGYLNTIDHAYRKPTVVRLAHQVKRPVPVLKVTRKSILARDDHTCQYCGHRVGGLTLDHIIPKDRGGSTDWDNLVCCCLRCNNRKGNRTPSEADMVLLKKPRKPRFTPYISFPKFVMASKIRERHDFLGAYLQEWDLGN